MINIAQEKFNIQAHALISSDYQTLIEDKCQLNNLWILQCFSRFVRDAQDLLIDHELERNAHYLLEEFSSINLNEEFLRPGGVIDNFLESRNYWNVLSTCQKILNSMTQMMVDRTHELHHRVKTLLLDQGFENEMKKAMKLVEPLIAIHQKCDQDNFLLADGVQALLEIEAMEDNPYVSILPEIDPMLTPLSLIANFLHPVYRGKLFLNNNSRFAKVNDFCLDELNDEGLQRFTQYKTNTDTLAHPCIQEIENWLIFWQAVSLNNDNFSSFAIKVLQSPAALPKLNSSPVNVNNLSQKLFDESSDYFYFLNF